MVLFSTNRLPLLMNSMPPPLPEAVFDETVLLRSVTKPLDELWMPPPLPDVAALPVMTTPVSVRASSALRMPAPLPATLPPVIVRPEMLTFKTPVPEMLNTRTALLPLTVTDDAPGPVMVTLSEIVGRVLASVIVPVRPDWKTIVSGTPAEALAVVIAARNEPVPESARVVTVSVWPTRTWKVPSVTG